MNEYEKIMLLDRAIAEMQKALDTQYRERASRHGNMTATSVEITTVENIIAGLITKRNQLLFNTAKTVAAINDTIPAWIS